MGELFGRMPLSP